VSKAISQALLRWVENLLIVGFVAMIAIVFGNVVMRYVFDSGIIMAEEVSRMIFVWLTFGGAYLVAREFGHLGMTMVVEKLGRGGRWWCRLAAEAFSVICMILLIVGCWRQSLMNIDNLAPITGAPLAIPYIAGLLGGIGIAAVNLITIWRLLTGQIPDDQLVVGAESEDLAQLDLSHNNGKAP
jgi:TRAP-type C4-dicarboxylate transport system permease small subunit